MSSKPVRLSEKVVSFCEDHKNYEGEPYTKVLERELGLGGNKKR